MTSVGKKRAGGPAKGLAPAHLYPLEGTGGGGGGGGVACLGGGGDVRGETHTCFFECKKGPR